MVRRQFGHRRLHREVGITVADVETAQLFAVEQEAVGIVVVVRGQDAPPGAFLGRDLLAQGGIVERLVADEGDARHAGGRAFRDRIDQIDAILRPLDDLRIDRRGEFAVAAVELDDALNVRLNLGAGEDHTRLHLRFFFEVLGRDLGIALEIDAVDDRIFDHMHGHGRAVEVDLHVREQTGGEQRLQRLVGGGFAVIVAFVQRDVGENGGGFDALGAGHHDAAHDRRCSRFHRRGSIGTARRLRLSRCFALRIRRCRHDDGRQNERRRRHALQSGEQGLSVHSLVSDSSQILRHIAGMPCASGRDPLPSYLTRSFQVAKIMRPSTNASPSLNPTSWVRSLNGRPRTPSHA